MLKKFVPYHRRISFVQARNVLLVAFMLGLVTVCNQVREDMLEARSENNRTVHQIMEMQRQAAAQAAWQFDNALAERLLSGLFLYTPVLEAKIVDDGGRVLADKQRDDAATGARRRWLADAMIGKSEYSLKLFVPNVEDAVGTLSVRISSNLIAETFFNRTERNIISAVVPLIILALILLLMFYSTLTKPFFHLASRLSEVNAEQPMQSRIEFLPGHQNDELALVVATTNELLSQFEQLLSKHEKAKQELIVAEKKYRSIFDNALEGIYQVSLDGHFLTANPALAKALGYESPEELISKITDIEQQLYHDKVKRKETLARLMLDGFIVNAEAQFRRKDGSLLWGSQNARIVRDNKGVPLFIEGMVADITGPKQAMADLAKVEAQLMQAQKMESVGRLAGGVAHDYNNMLSVILGYTELSLGALNQDHPLYGNLEEILKATRRSIEVTRQLLAFARKQTIAPKVINLNKTIEGMLNMLRRLIGEDIDLVWISAENLWSITIDPSQIDQILANLLVNARDAIADTGKITIETGMVTFDQAYCDSNAGFIPGNFVLLAVSDDGSGIDSKTKEKLFEPFFTTKIMGQGTGLGLATVYGIVKQNNGFINVYSELGQGTTFKIYFPSYDDLAVASQQTMEAETPRGNAEVIMIVEDEVAILNLCKTMLQQVGYTVLALGSPSEALKMADEYKGKISLLITDVIMPEMNGRNLADHLHRIYPDIKFIFMSGYTANVIAHHGVLDEGINFIQKPFTLYDLAIAVHKVLSSIDKDL